MIASLWPDARKLNRPSGLRTPSQMATPGSARRLRAMTGSEAIMATTPMISRQRKVITCRTSVLPATVAAPELSVTHSGP